jgi:single-strand DNA-binding protein
LLLGHLGADPELRSTTAGQAVLNFRIATTESYYDKNKELQSRTEWHRVTVWGKRGEGLAKILTKGSKVLVEGRLQTSSYEKDGQKKYSTDVIATDVFLAGGKRPGQGESYGNMPAPPPPEPARGFSEDIPF